MLTRALHLLATLRASFWLVPTVMAVAAIALSQVMVALDGTLNARNADLPAWIYSGGAEGARAVLTTVAGSMIGIAGITFSVTIVALTLASSQFGPRLQKHFMRDRGNQIVLGTYIATFLYCLMLLPRVRSVEEALFVPHASITLAIGLALASLGVLIYFIHHVAESIQASTVIELVGRDLDNAVHRFTEQGFGWKSSDERSEAGGDKVGDLFPDEPNSILSDRFGYVQAIDLVGLVAAAKQAGCVLRLVCRPGNRVFDRVELARSSGTVTDELCEAVQKAFVIGTERTGDQDIEYAALQLVEVAVRALSPGINDPFTAIHCVDRLGQSIARLAQSPLPPLRHRDANGALRVVADFDVFDGFARAAFDQIRQNSRGNVAVTIRLLETLEAIAPSTSIDSQRATLRRQADLIWNGAKADVPDESDRDDVRERYERATHALA